MDYKRLLEIVKKSGFKGYIGIEFEGKNQPEADGIRKTKALIERYCEWVENDNFRDSKVP